MQASSLLVRVARELRTALDQRFAKFDLTSQQAGVLIHVHTGETSPTRLAELLGADTASVTRLVDRLAAKGLLEREPDPSDRRAIVVRLTTPGSALIPELPPVFESVGAELMRGADAEQVATSLATMLANLGDQSNSVASTAGRVLAG